MSRTTPGRVRWRSALGTVVMLVAFQAAEPDAAHAHGDLSGQSGMLILPAAMSWIVFGSADLAYGLQGELLPPGWAVTQILFAGLGSFAVVGSRYSRYLDGSQVALSAGLGCWFLGHGVLSLALPGAGAPPSRAPPPRKRSPRAGVSLSPGGVSVRVRAAF